MYTQTIRDISLFSDPATAVDIKQDDNRLLVEIVRNGDLRRYFFASPNGPIEARHNNRQFASLASLLSSDEFADLRRFADTQRRILGQKGLENLIEPTGLINPNGPAEPFALEQARQLLRPSATSDSLKVILVDGPAGVGKTSLIERLVFERCGEPSLPPILHITSKGRRLSNLPDAIGKTASDADARFRADQVPVLARLGALQVAIDGFDELVQPDGYGNAWGALKDLVRSISTGGPLILAGRDTFFDQQDLERRFDTFGSRIELTMVRLAEVDEHVAVNWLINNGWSESDLTTPQAREFFKRSYVRRPFFLATIASLHGFENIPAEMGSPQSILVTRLLDREAKLLITGLPNVTQTDVEEALHRLCEELAVDMAERESDSVSLEYVEFTAEFVFHDLASEDERNALLKKVGSLAFLEIVESGSDRRFPHSEIQNHFFATALYRSLSRREFFPPLRAVLYGGDVIEAFAEVMRSAPIEMFHTALGYLLELRNSEKFSQRLKANSAAFILGALVRGESNGRSIDLRQSEINEVRVFDQLSAVDLSNSMITRLDARGADLAEVVFAEAYVATLLVDDTTFFGTSVPSVGVLQIEREGRIQAVHDDVAKAAWLKEHSELAEAEEDWDQYRELPLVKYFDRLCRRFLRQHEIRDGEADDASVLFRNEHWPEVQQILGDRIVTRTKDSRGTNDLFYHLYGPGELLAPVHDDEAKRIRAEVIRKARLELA